MVGRFEATTRQVTGARRLVVVVVTLVVWPPVAVELVWVAFNLASRRSSATVELLRGEARAPPPRIRIIGIASTAAVAAVARVLGAL